MTIVRVGVPTDIHPDIGETELQRLVGLVARLFGWRTYHPPDNRPITSRRGTVYRQDVDPGWPDLVLARAGTVLFRELKTRTGRLSPAQRAWHEALAAAGLDVAIWRPAMWPEIVATLAPND